MRPSTVTILRRRLLFPLAAATLVWVVVEILSLVVLFATQRGFHPRRSSAQRAVLKGGGGSAIDDTDPARLRRGSDVVHPYLGYVREPQRDPRTFWDVRPDGFLARKGATPVAEGSVVVGVFGGSVANILALGTEESLLEELSQSPRFAGRTLRITSYAMGGYKQPQQLMALAWALSLDHPLDLVIELDGFNEVTLPVLDLWPAGVYPFYPNLWPRRVSALPDLDAQETIGRLALVRRLRTVAARSFEGPLRRYSPTCELLWSTVDGVLEGRETGLQERLSAAPGEALSFLARGPEGGFPDEESLLNGLVSHWERSSLLMRDMAEGRGIPYVHFLQPNQYVEGAKPLSAEERRRFAPAGHRNERPVRLGYPALRAAGRRLAAAGVAFHDLSRLFADEPATMYSDNCCHLNGVGNRRLAREVGRLAVADLANGSEP